jgi:DNA-binding XRE family transcriptional regulator
MDATIIWDLEDDVDGNVQHLREHDVTIEEAEEVLLDPRSSRAVSRTSGLPTVFGWTSTGPAPRGGLRTGGRRPVDVAAGHGLRCTPTWVQEEREEEMNARRIFRASRKTAEERVHEQTLRQKLQKERPSLEDLVRTGACDPDAVMTMGMYFDVQKALQALKRDRERCGLSIGDVAERSGLDRAVVSRLENGKQDNPTVTTLMRYAAALGKRFLWSYEDLATQVTGSNGKASRR